MGTAFANGLQWGEGQAAGQRAHKQALSDQELQTKIGGLIDNRKSIQAKLPTLLDDKGNPTPQYTEAINALTQNARDLREVYHPEKNPGAVERFGHLLTDALHITKPEDRIKKEAAKRESSAAMDEKTAQGVAAAAPISPQVAAGQQTQVEIDRQNAINNAKIQWLKDHNASPEIIEQATQSIGGVPITRGTKATGQPYQDANDKKWYQRYLNADGTDYRAEVPGYTPKPSSGKPSNIETERESYRADHGIPSGQPLTFKQEADFVKQISLARNPFGPQRIGMEREGLDLREQEAGFRDFMSLQKQLTPIERVIGTATETNSYVSNPTGPGDVALTLAFFDAIKTTGVRFTKQEQDFITGSRGLVDAAQAKFDQGFQGTVFGPPGSPQRAIIASIVKKAGEMAQQQKNTLIGGAAAFNPKVANAVGGAAKHKIKIGSKFYTYNGTGNTADINNYTEVKQ